METTTFSHDAAGQRVKVLYIGGCGRSGSTLLDRMLGQVPGVCSLGELTHLWKALLDNAECGCGAAVHDCPFWHAVGQRAFGGWERVDVARIRHLQRAVQRQRYVPFMMAPALWPPYRAKLARYARVLGDLYRGVQEASGAALIVDSTKHYSGAFLLGHVGGLDLQVAHLVRDSRGVAYSWTKTVARPEAIHKGAPMNRYSPGRSACRWLGYNAGFEVLARRGIRSTLVRYEDLVRSPRIELERLLEHAGVRPEGLSCAFIHGHDVALGPNHTVAGNPMRFRVGSVRLRVDDDWKRSFPRSHRRVVSVLTRPLLVRYGYGNEGPGDDTGAGAEWSSSGWDARVRRYA